ncbi:hypothetical protein CR205_03100 [Alteribacter lacisalsi]|uniref:Uncharacterized protein n=1 Tax=Alteribacter lacisalsi TaxID=2045244 RepID=A0A2W0H8V7_9BACI|nr:hypothetical protein [Alteribacter lacisalsi]PYZ97597.1 hypothetical protein CR205_03100 [Alteribacter lacisalsi]
MTRSFFIVAMVSAPTLLVAGCSEQSAEEDMAELEKKYDLHFQVIDEPPERDETPPELDFEEADRVFAFAAEFMEDQETDMPDQPALMETNDDDVPAESGIYTITLASDTEPSGQIVAERHFSFVYEDDDESEHVLLGDLRTSITGTPAMSWEEMSTGADYNEETGQITLSAVRILEVLFSYGDQDVYFSEAGNWRVETYAEELEEE